MGTIAAKLADLSGRISNLEAKIAVQTQQAAFLQEHGRPYSAPNLAVSALLKRLVSLQRSRQILARHAVATPANRPAILFDGGMAEHHTSRACIGA